jgi:hypothetical protein
VVGLLLLLGDVPQALLQGIRLMHSNPDRVREVAELLIPLLRASGVLMVGDETELPNRRDGGLRIVFELIPARRARALIRSSSPALGVDEVLKLGQLLDGAFPRYVND